ncbi:M1 family aminopeptidase [Pedobacter foliorum]|uniref:M1 family metallopeptidase n=1 Tax=Pedobacter foliorum TaxID=2739058 RepID=UPI00156733BE|nr:M1 family aminopeptidase [Pedobacter foliorum]NRF40260.1 ERAP1-like C-terminal domain-containing protein [Pedobacter foliorum]
MVNLRNSIAVLAFLFVSCSGVRYVSEPVLEVGVSKNLAVYRKSVLSNINYKLELDIPRNRDEIISAVEEVTFQLSANKYPLQMDFRENAKKIKVLQVNGVNVGVNHKDEHLIVESKYLKQGVNVISLSFEAGEAALNRNNDYLYSLFVPDRARTVFPCFDQPDLKATYSLTLKVPNDWKAMANGTLKDSVITGDRKTYNFNKSDTLSTYLFAFAVGKFTLAEGKVGNMVTDFLYRETDTLTIKNSVDEVFNIHTKSLKYLEDWTGIPYPFQKFGFVAIPDFQFGGMEHVGAIQYKSSALFLDEGATKDQLNARNNLIAHETAHMWFGDLVTMNWFTDVWMKEVFANFMADKSTEEITGKEVFDLKFLTDHFPAAYSIDRTKGSNPIRQDLDNLKDAGTLYGNIIYHKAPIVMRQLERLMGKEKFQMGVREYLKEFTNKNASWPDLIRILDKYTEADLQKWNKVWVNEVGRPVIDYTIEKANNKIKKFVITQKSEYGADRIWPQLMEVTLYYPNRSEELTVNLNSKSVELKAAEGMELPSYVLFNSSGQGYGLWPLDKSIYSEIFLIGKAVNRSSAYISLYENMLNGRYIKPLELLNLFVKGLDQEKEELNLKLITNYISNIYWEFISEHERASMFASLENALWNSMQKQSLPNNKKVLFKTYQDVYQSAEAGKRLNAIWETQKVPAGIKLTEDDYTSLAFSLVLRDGDSSILDKQLKRITNVDRRKRFEFIMPAVSSSMKKRDDFFKSLELKYNRDKESNVGAALYYLHHPLRQRSSFRYLEKSLDMLSEIQKTGDIFFPQNWLQATFGYYQSKEALKIIEDFLEKNPQYNPKLKAKILQCSDNLFRAQKLLSE